MVSSATFHALAIFGVGALAMSPKVKAVIGAVAAVLATVLLVNVLHLREPAARPNGGNDGRVFTANPVAVDRDGASAPIVPAPATSAKRAELTVPSIASDPRLTFVVRGTTHVFERGPTGGMRVHAELYDGYEADSAPIATTDFVSDDHGEVVWALLPPRGTVTLVVTSRDEDYAPAESRVLLLGGEPPIPFDLFLFPFDATVTGTVSDEQGRPLADAMVRSFYDGSACECGESGAYRLRTNSAGSLSLVTASAPGFAEATTAAALHGPGSTATLDFRLSTEFTVSGRITDERGAPVPGAKVTTSSTHFNHVASDADGHYAMRGLDPLAQELPLRVEHDRFVPASAEVRATGSGTTTHDFVLQRGARVEGIVLGPDGRPLCEAALWIGFNRYIDGVPKATSRDDGSFTFAHVAPGDHTLGGEAAGLPAANARLVVPPETERVEGVELRFATGRFLAGIVTDAAGAPVAGASVNASRDGSIFDRYSTTDADGRFRLQSLSDPPLVVMTVARGFTVRRESFAVLDRDDVVLVLASAGRLAGRVVDAVSGEPIESFRIRFVQPQLEVGDRFGSGYGYVWSEPGQAFTSVDGTWRCDDQSLEVGAIFAVEATAAGYAPAIAPRVAASPDPDPAALVLRLSRGASVVGQVVSDGGQPVADALVTLATPSLPVRPLPFHPVERDARWIVRSDAAGAFAIEGAPAGECTLVVQHPEWIDAVDGPFIVPASGSVPPRRIDLARGGAIEGLLLDAHGAPEGGRQVTLFPTEDLGPLAQMQMATTDGAGRFVFDQLASSTYQVSSQLRGDLTFVNELSARVIVVAPESASVRLEPQGSARVTGRVTSERKLPAAIQVTLHRIDPPGENSAEGLLPDRGTFALGENFEFARVEPGTYKISASCYLTVTKEWIEVSDAITVADGGFVDVVLRLPSR